MASELPPELASLADPTLAPSRAPATDQPKRDLIGRFGLGVTALGGFRDRFSRTAREDEIVSVLSRVTLEGTGRPVRKKEIAWAYNCVDGLVFQLADGPLFGVRTRG